MTDEQCDNCCPRCGSAIHERYHKNCTPKDHHKWHGVLPVEPQPAPIWIAQASVRISDAVKRNGRISPELIYEIIKGEMESYVETVPVVPPEKNTRFFIDTEFIESGPGQPIELLSIGIICDDGRELYAVNADADLSNANDWVKANVLPHLLRYDDLKVGEPRRTRESLREYVREFVGDCKPEFWGYYADYDWVVFCQLFGAMAHLPKDWPMYCRDIKQLCADKGDPELPKQTSAEHHALNDAKWNKRAFDFLQDHAAASQAEPTYRIRQEQAERIVELEQELTELHSEAEYQRNGGLLRENAELKAKIAELEASNNKLDEEYVNNTLRKQLDDAMSERDQAREALRAAILDENELRAKIIEEIRTDPGTQLCGRSLTEIMRALNEYDARHYEFIGAAVPPSEDAARFADGLCDKHGDYDARYLRCPKCEEEIGTGSAEDAPATPQSYWPSDLTICPNCKQDIVKVKHLSEGKQLFCPVAEPAAQPAGKEPKP